MKSGTIRLVVVLATISVLGIVLTQLFWTRKAFNLEDTRFNISVNNALREVANQIYAINESTDPDHHTGSEHLPLTNVVRQPSDSYFLVMINGVIDTKILETLLKGEFEKRGIMTDFEYAIYDCHREKMVYGNYVKLDKSKDGNERATPTRDMPKWANEPYYFGVSFPLKSNYLVGKLGIWIFSSLVLLLVIAFFAFALFVIFQQKRLWEVQRDFINNMTHEFKTPISTIAISAGVLKQPNAAANPERLARYATIIETEALRLKNQVERVLQMATIDEDRVKVKQEMIDLHEIVGQAVESIDTILKEKGGSVECHLEANNPRVWGDKLHLTNIIYNLLDNAVKYSKYETPPHVCIRTHNTRRGISLRIEDNGIGIAKEYLQKVFDKFYRVPTGNVHDVKGFGLGLNYVRVVVGAHRGKIRLDSKVGDGTSVTLFLPFGATV